MSLAQPVAAVLAREAFSTPLTCGLTRCVLCERVLPLLSAPSTTLSVSASPELVCLSKDQTTLAKPCLSARSPPPPWSAATPPGLTPVKSQGEAVLGEGFQHKPAVWRRTLGNHSVLVIELHSASSLLHVGRSVSVFTALTLCGQNMIIHMRCLGTTQCSAWLGQRTPGPVVGNKTGLVDGTWISSLVR